MGRAPAYRRWANWMVLGTALTVPLIFVPQFRDAFALPKLASLYLLVPLAAAGPIAYVVLAPPRVLPLLRIADAAAAAFALLALISTLLSAFPAHSLQGEPLQYQGLFPMLLYVAGYFLARLAFRSAEELRNLFTAVSVAGTLVAAYALLQALRLDPIWHSLDKGRVFSTLGQANDLGAYAVLAAPAAFALFATGGRRVRWLGAMVLLLLLGGLVFTYSRGGYLGLAAEVLVIGVLLMPAARFSYRHVGRAVLGIMLAGMLVVAIPAGRATAVRAIDRAFSIGNLSNSSIQDHLDLWAVGLRITLDHPLAGTGPDSYVLVFPAYRDIVLSPARAAFEAHFRPESPHDVYLAISSGLGVPALASYIALIAAVLAGLWRALRLQPRDVRVLLAALAAAIIGHLVTDAFITGELTGSWLFWTYMGVAVGLASCPRRKGAVGVFPTEDAHP